MLNPRPLPWYAIAAGIALLCNVAAAQDLPCASNCSDHGVCVNGACVCDEGWSGDACACSTATCPADCGIHGECVCGVCVCADGWAGQDCSCTTSCANHGACLGGVCQCDEGWTGDFCECSTAPCVLDCSGNGDCVCGICECDDGWSGVACSCQELPCDKDCSEHGTCACDGICACDPGWSGSNCSSPCPNLCSGRGVCTDGVCDCPRFWAGSDCSDPDYIRVFMATDDTHFESSITERPVVDLQPGTSATIMVWIEDTRQAFPLSGIQPIIRWFGLPGPGTEGSVRYINLPYFACALQTDGMFGQPCVPNGGFCSEACVMFDGSSIRIDELRQDYVFSENITYPPIFHENAPEDNGLAKFGAFAQHVDATTGSFLNGIHYVAEFDIEISPDASGQFSIGFVRRWNGPIALTHFFRPLGQDFEVDLFQDLTVVVNPQPIAFNPVDRAIDARQTSAPDGSERAGWDRITWLYNADMNGLTASDFEVLTTDGTRLNIADITVEGGLVEVVFDGPIPPGQCVRVTDMATGASATLGHLPGDVNADRVVNPGDLLELIDDINGLLAPPLSRAQYDIDRTGDRSPRDILRLIDLFNGADAYEPWLGRTLGACPQ